MSSCFRWERQLDGKKAILFGGPGNGGRGSGEAQYGWEGRVVIRGAISYTLHFMYCFDSLRQPMPPGMPGPPDYRGGSKPEPRHQQHGGKCSPLLKSRHKERRDASCFFSVVTILAQFRAVPVHGYLVIIWGDISVQAVGEEQEGGHRPRKSTLL